MNNKKTSFICTVFNEEKTITRFLESIYKQSRLPDEIIIVDGGSKDNTASVIHNFKSKKRKKINLEFFVKKGNRSVGRNFGIQKAKGSIILCSDAGCILDKDWVKEIVKSFKNRKVDVVAGYYKGIPENIFQKSLVPYVLVMEDKIIENDFLPATRSMAFKKSVWNIVGGFDEKLSHNEDYAFANKLKKIKANIVFAKNALVYWIPRKNIEQAFIMFFRFAYGDAESNIFRDKVLLIYARYLFYIYLISLTVLIKSLLLLYIILIFPIIYITWSIWKNYKYVKSKMAYFLLPIIQIVSDVAVLTGTTAGYLKYIFKLNYKKIILENKGLIILLGVYILSMLSVISTGIPNQSHPFPYMMDEWHQLQAVKNVFKFGTPNLSGSANGSMFHFFLSGILLVPFVALKIVNPFTIKSAVDSLNQQEILFNILRLNTLFFGVLTLVLMSKIAKVLKLNQFLSVLLFFATSVWLVLSNFFKYDIALIFWIVFALYYLIRYSSSPSFKNFFLVCFLSALAFSVKVSALPLFPILVLAYLVFTPKVGSSLKQLFLGIFIYLFTAIFFGIPDIVFGGRNMFQYLYENIVIAHSLTSFNLHEPLLTLIIFNRLPVIFGHAFYFLTIGSFVYVLFLIIKGFKNKNNYQILKLYKFITLSFIFFALSLVPLGIAISANRAIVLLPFMVIFCLIAIRDLYLFLKNKPKTKLVFTLFFVLLLFLQIFESYIWLYLKLSPLPEKTSSSWVVKNIPKESSIGLENIPLYQGVPDFILNEFYRKQYNPNFQTTYNYQIIDANTQILPKYIILSNVNYEAKYFKISAKNDLIKRIKDRGYKKVKDFPLELSIYNYFEKNYYTPYAGVFAYPESITIFER